MIYLYPHYREQQCSHHAFSDKDDPFAPIDINAEMPEEVVKNLIGEVNQAADHLAEAANIMRKFGEDVDIQLRTAINTQKEMCYRTKAAMAAGILAAEMADSWDVSFSFRTRYEMFGVLRWFLYSMFSCVPGFPKEVLCAIRHFSESEIKGLSQSVTEYVKNKRESEEKELCDAMDAAYRRLGWNE